MLQLEYPECRSVNMFLTPSALLLFFRYWHSLCLHPYFSHTPNGMSWIQKMLLFFFLVEQYSMRLCKLSHRVVFCFVLFCFICKFFSRGLKFFNVVFIKIIACPYQRGQKANSEVYQHQMSITCNGQYRRQIMKAHCSLLLFSIG